MENAPRVVLELQQQHTQKNLPLVIIQNTNSCDDKLASKHQNLHFKKKNTEKMFASIVDGSMRDSIEHISRIGQAKKKGEIIRLIYDYKHKLFSHPLLFTLFSAIIKLLPFPFIITINVRCRMLFVIVGISPLNPSDTTKMKIITFRVQKSSKESFKKLNLKLSGSN